MTWTNHGKLATLAGMRPVISVLICLTLAACEVPKKPPPPARQSRELIVLTRNSSSTYYDNGSGQPVGLEHDLAMLFGKELGVPVKFIVAKQFDQIGDIHRVAVLVVAFAQLRAAGDESPLIETPTTAAVAMVTVEPSALVGLPTAQASELLTAAGLVVALRPVDDPAVAAGLVTAVDPSGQVPSGATVTLSVSNGVPATTISTEPPKEKGKGRDGPKP